MKKIVMVIAAHPDDEILGCGGTMAKHSAAGDEVHVIFLAEGLTARDEKFSSDRWAKEQAKRTQAAHQANRVLGVRSVTIHNYPDNRLDSVDLLDLVKKIETLKKKIRPQIVYTHHAGDVNIDHRRVHDAVIAASRPVPGESIKTVLFFEVASSTEWRPAASGQPFNPDWFVDISSTLKKKIKALGCYGEEMRPWPHSRSLKAVEHLAHWRGATIGAEAAEAFVLGRNIVS